jgi:hypothetical protein
LWQASQRVSALSRYNKDMTSKLEMVKEEMLKLKAAFHNKSSSPPVDTKNEKKELVAYETAFMSAFDRRLFVFWMGNNEMSVNRKNCLETIKQKSGLEMILVTRDNLETFVKITGVALHNGYNLLAAIHKSDYLRSYFMHFFGGAYSDLKTHKESWVPEISKTMKNDSLFGCGMQEIRGGSPVGSLYNKTEFLISNGGFFFKPRTNFTSQWYDSVQEEMDKLYLHLLKHPGTHLTREMEPGYPVSWAQIQGVKFHPVVYQYRHHLSRNLPWISLSDYI